MNERFGIPARRVAAWAAISSLWVGVAADGHAADLAEAADDIHAVVLLPQWGVGGHAGATALKYRPIVLGRDGRARRAWGDPAAREGAWQLDGKALSIRWTDGSSTNNRQWSRCLPADRSFRLVGRFEATSHAGAAGATAIAVRGYTFDAAGTFRSSRTVGSQAAGVSAASSKDDQGHYRLDRHRLTLQREGAPAETQLFCRFPDSDKAVVIGTGIYTAP